MLRTLIVRILYTVKFFHRESIAHVFYTSHSFIHGILFTNADQNSFHLSSDQNTIEEKQHLTM